MVPLPPLSLPADSQQVIAVSFSQGEVQTPLVCRADLHQVVLVLHRLPPQRQQLHQLRSSLLHEGHALCLGLYQLLGSLPLLLVVRVLCGRPGMCSAAWLVRRPHAMAVRPHREQCKACSHQTNRMLMRRTAHTPTCSKARARVGGGGHRSEQLHIGGAQPCRPCAGSAGGAAAAPLLSWQPWSARLPPARCACAPPRCPPWSAPQVAFTPSMLASSLDTGSQNKCTNEARGIMSGPPALPKLPELQRCSTMRYCHHWLGPAAIRLGRGQGEAGAAQSCGCPRPVALASSGYHQLAVCKDLLAAGAYCSLPQKTGLAMPGPCADDRLVQRHLKSATYAASATSAGLAWNRSCRRAHSCSAR